MRLDETTRNIAGRYLEISFMFIQQDMNFLFNFDILHLLLKTNGGTETRSNFIIFVIWNSLIVIGCLVVAWSKKFCIGDN